MSGHPYCTRFHSCMHKQSMHTRPVDGSTCSAHYSKRYRSLTSIAALEMTYEAAALQVAVELPNQPAGQRTLTALEENGPFELQPSPYELQNQLSLQRFCEVPSSELRHPFPCTKKSQGDISTRCILEHIALSTNRLTETPPPCTHTFPKRARTHM